MLSNLTLSVWSSLLHPKYIIQYLFRVSTFQHLKTILQKKKCNVVEQQLGNAARDQNSTGFEHIRPVLFYLSLEESIINAMQHWKRNSYLQQGHENPGWIPSKLGTLLFQHKDYSACGMRKTMMNLWPQITVNWVRKNLVWRCLKWLYAMH